VLEVSQDASLAAMRWITRLASREVRARPFDTRRRSASIGNRVVNIDQELCTSLQRVSQSGQLIGVRALAAKNLLLGAAFSSDDDPVVQMRDKRTPERLPWPLSR
jgi:hypothetical protein